MKYEPINSPISWFGGKYRLRKLIISLIPDDHDSYVEVFGGAGWVLFGKEPSNLEVYNDIDGELVNFFQTIKYCSKSFIDYSFDLLNSRDIFYLYRDQSREDLNEIERAARFYYLNRTSFGSMNETYGISRSRPNKLHRDDRITYACKRLRDVVIEHLDWSNLISRYDYSKAFFYLDPPYETPASKFYCKTMSPEDYRALAETLKKIKGRFLLSINDSENIRRTFEAFQIHEIETKYSVNQLSESRKEIRTELLISNFDCPPEKLIQGVIQ